MILSEHYTLSNGVEIPKLGLGTWFINNRDVVRAVQDAVDVGYRHIDTAQAYRNEKGVGEAVRASNVPREDLFVTTKLVAGAKSYRKAVAGIDRSLRTLGLDHIDLMIIHSPQPWSSFRGDNRYLEENREVWRALEEAYDDGKLRAIGVSNFDEQDLDNILGTATVAPMVNQVLAHVSNTPHELIDYCQSRDVLVEAYSPVAHGELLTNDQVAEIAARYDVSVPQLSIRYDLQLGLLPLPKTAKVAHMRNNADLDFVISDEDMDTLRHVDRIEDYGDASVMPVYGGQMNLRSMARMIRHSMRR
ncbi:aldo/keto reductase [Isoptericola sp. AK164]|uniref:aldo/keto reductase n=1 Tax=Isoptericola sp. AK164 TaxID=3024246 RepID=UPI0024183ED9|nr:aldo/keto reductase [Isoptericola sp. AK164]